MPIKYKIKDGNLHLLYSPENGSGWIFEKFNEEEKIPIRKTFHFNQTDLAGPIIQPEYEFEELEFLLGVREENYISIDRRILKTKHDVLIDANIFIRKTEYAGIDTNVLKNVSSIDKVFISYNNISIFSKIESLCNERIIIGGEDVNAIPCETFSYLINRFPNKTELKKYQNSRITNILQEYYDSITDGEKELQRYLKRKETRLEKLGSSEINKRVFNVPNELYELEIEKYKSICKFIKDMLSNGDSYSEREWQEIVLNPLKLIFPQYVAVLKEVSIRESYSREFDTKRSIDFILVNANGYVDILEIKRPFESCILNTGLYRDNYIPKRELSGAIMQTEKYIYYLNSLTRKDEEKLTNKYEDQLPLDCSLKIRNPKALILLGRSHQFDDRRQTDFEFIKRKYSNITDILTYDDLLNRIENTIGSLEKRRSSS